MADLDANKALIAAHFEAIWTGDDAAIRAQLADGFFDHAAPPGTPQSTAAVIEWARPMRAVFPDMKVTIDQAVAEGELVAVHATWRGTQKGVFHGIPPTGRTISFTGMVFWRIVEGKIAGRWAHIDFASAIRQLKS